jgi:ABC-2 type transport system ATP-binding protein
VTNPDWVVETDGLTRQFGRFVAVDDVTLRVPRGSIFGFLGPSGSGKTTTMRMLCGLLKPTAGRAVVNGFDIERDPETLRKNLGYMSQRFALYADLSVRENLEFYGGIYGVIGDRLENRIQQIFTQLDLGSQANALTASLPLGWKQRVALGAAILHEPPVLFLDEPTSGVDPASRRLFWEILDELATGGTSIFVSTHAMDEVERCDLVGIMYSARLIANNNPSGLKDAFSGFLYHVEAEPLLEALNVAGRLPSVQEASLFGKAIHLTADAEDAEGWRRSLEAAGVAVHDIHRIPPELEDVFVQLIAHSERAAKSPAAGSTP